jgi:hypothetical protein
MLHIDSKVTIADCEKILAKIDLAGPEILCATNVKHAHFGGEASLIQVIATWGRRYKEALLKSYDDGSGSVLAELVRTAHGLTALTFARRTVSRDSKLDLTDRAISLASTQMDFVWQGSYRSAIKGVGTLLLCSTLGDREFLPALYYPQIAGQPPKFRSESEIAQAMSKAFEASVSGAQFEKRLSHPKQALIGAVVFELLRNTDEHARTDLKGDNYARSVRGVLLREHNIKTSDIGAFSEFHGLCDYLTALSNIPGKESRLLLLELSIFDSGPGLASRFLAKEHFSSPSEELTAIRECLRLHKTTKSASGAGVGLYRTMIKLRSHGAFVRIRSGRISVYSDFLSGQADTDEFGLRDASTGDHVPTRMSWAAGSLFTILLPLWE